MKTSGHRSISKPFTRHASSKPSNDNCKSAEDVADDHNHEPVVISGHKITVVADVEPSGLHLMLGKKVGNDVQMRQKVLLAQEGPDEICTFPVDDDELTIQFNLKGGHPLKEHVTWYSRRGKAALKELETSARPNLSHAEDVEYLNRVKLDDPEDPKNKDLLIEFPTLKSGSLETRILPKDQVMRSLSTPEYKVSPKDPVLRSASSPGYTHEAAMSLRIQGLARKEPSGSQATFLDQILPGFQIAIPPGPKASDFSGLGSCSSIKGTSKKLQPGESLLTLREDEEPLIKEKVESPFEVGDVEASIDSLFIQTKSFEGEMINHFEPHQNTATDNNPVATGSQSLIIVSTPPSPTSFLRETNCQKTLKASGFHQQCKLLIPSPNYGLFLGKCF